jgi:hypothetical protein
MLLGQLSWIARSRRCRAGCRLSAICQQFVRERGEIRPYGAPQDNGSVVQNPLSSRLNVTRRHSPRRTESGVQVPPPTLGSLQKPWSEACGGGGGPVSGMSSIASCLHTGRSKPQNWCRSGSSDTSLWVGDRVVPLLLLCQRDAACRGGSSCDIGAGVRLGPTRRGTIRRGTARRRRWRRPSDRWPATGG